MSLLFINNTFDVFSESGVIIYLILSSVSFRQITFSNSIYPKRSSASSLYI